MDNGPIIGGFDKKGIISVYQIFCELFENETLFKSSVSEKLSLTTEGESVLKRMISFVLWNESKWIFQSSHNQIHWQTILKSLLYDFARDAKLYFEEEFERITVS